MAKIYNKSDTQYYPKLYQQKILIERSLGECFKCNVHLDRLKCTGTLKPTDDCREFKLKVVYDFKSPPAVYVISPKIEKIKHMYSDGRLCLYYPKESPWDYRMNVSETIIPWTVHWIIYYEAWLNTGIWYGPESDHTGEK
jgi:hypothetical protein